MTRKRTPTPPPEEAPEPASSEPTALPAAPDKAAASRPLWRKVLTFAGIGLGIVLVLVLATLIGGRMYLSTDGGREQLRSFISGKKVGRFGRIHIEGLHGDVLGDFTIDRLTITDAEGVWLEAKAVQIDWKSSPLLTRRFQANEVKAETIRLIRRPIVEPPTEPSGPQPIAVDIDAFTSDVILEEGFSKQYGHWRLTGDLFLPRRGQKQAHINAFSVSRPGDFLRVDAELGDSLDKLDLNVQAREALGGPIAGALGYSPDRRFTADIVVNNRVVDAVVRSGNYTPLTAKGRFSDTGARLGGNVDLAGSDLFAPLVSRLGRTARFGLASVPIADDEDQHGLAWTLTSENLTSRGQGVVNIKDRSSADGLDLQVSTPSLTRLIGTTLGGAADYRGHLTGDLRRWDIDGAIDLLAADLASYRAQRVRGPLDLSSRNGRIEARAELAAQGGSTQGIIGALLGASPQAKLTVVRTTDGNLLLEHIDGHGRALDLTGSGGRGLDGSLRFRGQADITDVGALYRQGRGGFSGTISAFSRRPGQPWEITYDGRGRRLAVGMEELDRLLGDQPRLQLKALMRKGQIELDPANLTGAKGQATARGLVHYDGRLQLALDWTADGPFGVGPVAVDGTMAGEGALTGTLAEPRADLRVRGPSITAAGLTMTETDLILSFRKGRDGSDGRFSLTGASAYGPARARSSFYLGGRHLRLTDVELDAGGVSARGAVSLSNNFPSSADLDFTARPGAFLSSGTADGRIRLTEDGGNNSAIVDVTASNVRLAGGSYVIRTLRLNGRGTLDRLPFTVAADIGGANPVRFDGTGAYSRSDTGSHALSLDGSGRVRDIAFETRSPIIVAQAGDGQVARVDLAVGGGTLIGEMRKDSAGAVINADLSAVEMGSLISDLRGRVTGRVAIQGRGDRLTGSASMALSNLRSVDAPADVAVDGTLNAILNDETLLLDFQAEDEGSVTAQANLVLPVIASAAPLRLVIPRERTMDGTIAIQGQVQPIWDVFMGGERSLSGVVDLQADVGGTLNDPRLTGRFNLNQGGFRDSSTGLRLRDVTLASRFDDTTALIQRFSASDGSGGAVTGDGRIGLREGSGSSFQLDLERFRIIDNDIAEARASGPLTVVRDADGLIKLAGEIAIDEARIEANPVGSTGIVRMDVIEINRPGGDDIERTVSSSTRPSVAMDIRLTSPNGNVRVVGRGLNLELGLNAHVTGTISEPRLAGSARVVRGDYEFAGKRFVFDDRGTVTLSTDPERIRLNLTAVREDPALTATIRITGTAARPEIELSSAPALPQDEILSQVLFGRSASQLSAFEAAQLAAGVAALAGGGGFDIMGNLRELAGLDRLSFGGEASALTVAGGRYITDDVYLEIIGGGEEGAAVNVEWKVRRNLSVSSRFNGNGDASLAIRWRRQSRPPGSRTDDTRPNR